MVDIPFNAKIRRIHELLFAAGATDILFVGGFVRDLALNVPSKDVDLEVYGLSYAQISAALRPAFHIGQVGQSFSVIKVDNEIDLAIPRRERKIGVGHCAFEVTPDSSMTFQEAASRRDFTVNAIGMRLDGSFCDPYDGLGDLKRGILRAPTERFCEDPLRVLRGMQFAARFGFHMEARTVEFCRRVLPEFETLSAERIYGELEKWAVKGTWPEKGLDVLRETGWITCFPELARMTETPQDLKIHPEGDVWTHTRQVCMAAAELAQSENLPDAQRLLLMFSALLHDVGKPVTFRKNEDGTISMPRHAEVGKKIAGEILSRLRAPISVMKAVQSLVGAHDFHAHREATPAHVRHLSVLLTPANIRLWRLLATADAAGRGVWENKMEKTREIKDVIKSETTEGVCEEKEPRTLEKVREGKEPRVSEKEGEGNFKVENVGARKSTVKLNFQEWVELAREWGVLEKQPAPILLGRDLETLGILPGKQMGEILREAWIAQLDGIFTEHEAGMVWLRKRVGNGENGNE